MHGMLKPEIEPGTEERPSLLAAMGDWARRNWPFLAIVILPSVLVALYMYGFASDQYIAEARFVVRQAQKQDSKSGLGLTEVLGMSVDVGGSRADAMSVNEYLRSDNAAQALARSIHLVRLFGRPEVDLISRLRKVQPAPEELGRYYRRQVDIDYNLDTGISSIKVAAFTPADAKLVADQLLALGEEQVNQLNERSMRDALRLSRAQMDEAEQAVTEAQEAVTAYRQQDGDIDPMSSATAQIGLVSGLTSSLAEARARLSAMGGIISKNSPQYVALAAQVRSLEAQVAQQESKLTRGGDNIASGLGPYQQLVARQEFAFKRYDAAASAYEVARQNAIKQQLYVVRVVDPMLPGKPLGPERGRITLTVFFSLLIAFGIGWLIRAGIREHVA